MKEKKEIDLSIQVEGDIPDYAWYGNGVQVSSSEDENTNDHDDHDDDDDYEDESDDCSVQEDVTGWYQQKNDYLRNNPSFMEIETDIFLRLLFCRGDDFEFLPFEEEWCEAYEWWTENPRDSKRPPKLSYVYNGIAQAIYGKKDKRNRTFVITSKAEKLYRILQHPFVVMSPISYTGKRRLKHNARYLYAMVIDLDDVDADNLDNLLFQSDPTRKHTTFPQPNIIVNSGNGIHLYYLLETPVPMFEDIYSILNKIKKELTRRIWNKGTTHDNPDKPQYQGNCQGFRLPGTQTKSRQKVTAFRNLNPHVKPYYKVEDLAYGGGGWITEEELAQVRRGTYNPNRCTLKQARELWPEWYERRIIQGVKPGRWFIKRDLYDWWKQQIPIYATVGHRYFCLMVLSMYAQKCKQLSPEEFRAVHHKRCAKMSELQFKRYYAKCGRGVTEEEFQTDLKELVPFLDGLSQTQNDRFTIEDAEEAAAAYKENYCTFPIKDIQAITGVPVERNQTRKKRSQKEHLTRASWVRDGLYSDWTIGRGRNRKQREIFEWRQEHPEGTKYACAKELKVDKKTVMKWWNSTEDEIIANEEQKSALMALKVRKSEESDVSTLHDIGAAYNAGYVTDRKVAEATMQHTEGYQEQTPETIRDTRDELTDAINFEALNVEEFMKSMGIPEFLIPMMKEEISRQMQTPEFWEKYKQTHPDVDMSKWPPQARNAYEAAVKGHREKK